MASFSTMDLQAAVAQAVASGARVVADRVLVSHPPYKGATVLMRAPGGELVELIGS